MEQDKDKEDLQLKLNISYPNDPNYEYLTFLTRVNLDKIRERSILSGNGFIIRNYDRSAVKLKKMLVDDEGIFSSRFGQSLQDVNVFKDRYRCKCGALNHRINHDLICPICGTKVKYVDDNFDYFGWIVLKDPYYIIHPNLYRVLEKLIPATVLDNILCPIDEHDENGHLINPKKKKNVKISDKYKDEPFKGIGILEFKERFDEIMDYYLKKGTNKRMYYDDIYKNKDCIFTQSIPVYTTHLRPVKLDGNTFSYEDTNRLYVMMVRLQAKINDTSTSIARKRKPKNQLLYDLHCKYMELYKAIIKIISGKKGTIRNLIGGRFNFTARCVIIPDSTLRIDQCRLSYYAALELLQQTIINILQKTYSISYSQAYKIWDKSQSSVNSTILSIMKGLIKDSVNGLPILINRNPKLVGALASDSQMKTLLIAGKY